MFEQPSFFSSALKLNLMGVTVSSTLQWYMYHSPSNKNKGLFSFATHCYAPQDKMEMGQQPKSHL